MTLQHVQVHPFFGPVLKISFIYIPMNNNFVDIHRNVYETDFTGPKKG